MKTLQIAKMATKCKRTDLFIEDKITICECLDKGSFQKEITCEYDISKSRQLFRTLLVTVVIFVQVSRSLLDQVSL